MSKKLIVTHQDHEDQTYLLKEGTEWVIGSSSDVYISLDDSTLPGRCIKLLLQNNKIIVETLCEKPEMMLNQQVFLSQKFSNYSFDLKIN